MLFFLGYDFARNPLRINAQTLAGLRFHRERARELRHADSFSVDFHKWGYVPYTSSLVMIRDKADLKALENDPENFIYFDRTQGQTHLQSTIECSRGAVGVFGAYAALRYLGMDGYRMLISHCLQNANYFRMRLQALPFVHLVAPENQGPSVAFRLYDPKRVRDAAAEYRAESRFRDDREYRERLRRNNAFHRRVHARRKNSALHTSWAQAIAHSEYDGQGRCAVLPGEKAVFLNPATTRSHIDAFVDGLRAGVTN
jgi:glutamate/tyrosine decarboxylase-like PLP-dependent enzyme